MIPYRPDMDLECSQDWGPFDDLMTHTSGPEFELARTIVADMCDRCEIRDACHALKDNERWVNALNQEKRTCERCGGTFDQPTQGRRKRFCTQKCRSAALHARRKAVA